jgi:DNA-directed RNA polymerase
LFKTVKIPRPDYEKRGNSDLSVHLRTDQVDSNKINRSLVANFIHYLDSRLNFLVLNKCRIDSIPLWTNQDCFYVCPTKKAVILKHYPDSFVELLIEGNVIDHF